MDINKRNPNLDLIRFVAIVLVMFVHSRRFLDASLVTSSVGSIDWWVNLLLFPVGACNALLVMVSGALLLRRVDDIGTFFRHRLSRILVPFVIWATVTFLLTLMNEGGPWGWSTMALYFRRMFTFGTNTAHWFVYMILGLYLFVPPLQRFVAHAEDSVLHFTLLVLAFLSGKTILLDCQTFEMLRSPDCLYFFAFLAGYASFHRWQSRSRFHAFNVVGLCLTGVLCLADGIWDFTRVPLDTFFAVFLFGLLLRVPLREGTLWNRFYSLVSRNSYGIYLSHFMFIPVLFPLMQYLPSWTTPFAIVLLTLAFESLLFALLERWKLTRYLT